MVDFLQLIRWKNLLIVGATQLLIALTVLYPILQFESIAPTLNILELGLIIFATMLMSAGGYIINDFYDQSIDLINKPAATYIGKSISPKAALQTYGLFGITGLLLVIYVAWTVDHWLLVPIYVISWGLLWGYSHSFKKTPLFGNVIVSLFCALVPGILLFAEWAGVYQLSGQKEGGTGLVLILVYILFAFLTTMIREIIKDMEDIQGDKTAGCRTLPIVLGINPTKAIILVLSVMLLFTLGVFTASLGAQGWHFSFVFTIIGIIAPFGYLLFKLAKAERTDHFAYLSAIMKFIMLAGLVLLIIFKLEVL